MTSSSYTVSTQALWLACCVVALLLVAALKWMEDHNG